MPQKVAQNGGLALRSKTACHTSHKKSCCFGKIQNMLKIPNFAQFWTNLTHFLPFLDDDGPVLRVFDPILSENTQKQGVKSENKFDLIKYPSHKISSTLGALKAICPYSQTYQGSQNKPILGSEGS